ncbi:MAG TPA: hypothetical protein PKV71_18635, partial [Calditrichia bacterium]|nr:hypothetical protein [Calditrichia bacterium]
EPGQKTAMAVQVNARGLLTGTYHHTLQLASNDPRHPWINLPVVLEVVPEESGLTENGDLRLRAAQRCFLNPGARIEFHLKGEKRVTLRVYDSEGFRVASLLEQSLKSGDYQMVWEARDPSLNPLPGGLYFCEISVGKDKEVRKMILLQ